MGRRDPVQLGQLFHVAVTMLDAGKVGFPNHPGIAGLLIPLLTWLLLRDLRQALTALVPVVTGLCALLGMMPVWGLHLNAPGVIAAMVVVGLAIDYGIFMVYTCRHRLNTGTPAAVSLSAVSTLVGAGVLLFANHPVLYAMGTTLVTGVLAGYLSSVVVVPALYRLWIDNGKEA